MGIVSPLRPGHAWKSKTDDIQGDEQEVSQGEYEPRWGIKPLGTFPLKQRAGNV